MTPNQGIASIIYEPEKGETENGDVKKEEKGEEKNYSVDEIIETSETVVFDSETNVNNDTVKVEEESGNNEDKKATKTDTLITNGVKKATETNTFVNIESIKSSETNTVNDKEKKASEADTVVSVEPEMRKSETLNKNSRKKFQNGAKTGPRFTVIGGQKVDLNTGNNSSSGLVLILFPVRQASVSQADPGADPGAGDEAESR